MQATGREELAGADAIPVRDLTPAHPLHTPSLPHIPTEVLAQIANHLDLPSSIAFARVGRRFAPLTTSKIWSSLDLFLPVHYGRGVYSWDKLAGAETTDGRDKAEADLAEEQHRRKMREKVRALINRGNEDRWKLVKRIKMVPRPGIVQGMVTILDLASQYVNLLDIDGPTVDRWRGVWERRDWSFEDLDFALLHCLPTLSFAALTHLRIGASSGSHASTILILCAMAPNLESLDVNLNHQAEVEEYDHHFHGLASSALSTYGRPFPLKRVPFDCNEYDVGLDTCDALELSKLISKSPQLQQLFVWHSVEDADRVIGILESAGGVAGIEELHLSLNMGDFNMYLEGSESRGLSFAKVRRLSLQFEQGLDILENLPKLPGMEGLVTIYQHSPIIDQSFSYRNTRYPGYPDPTCNPTILPSFAAKLRATPHLHQIRFIPDTLDESDIGVLDRLEAADDSVEGLIGVIASLRHGTHEILHVRLLLPCAEVADVPMACIDYGRKRYSAISYTTTAGVAHQKVFRPLAEPRWSEYCEYDGVAVPLDVMERMRAVEGLVGEGARGVEVGDAAWAVLTDWMAAREEQI